MYSGRSAANDRQQRVLMAAAAKRANQRGRIISRWSRGTKGAGKAWMQRTKGALVKHNSIIISTERVC